MVLVRTTNSAAVTTADTAITVASVTGFSAGYLIRIGDEVMRVVGGYVSGTNQTVPISVNHQYQEGMNWSSADSALRIEEVRWTEQYNLQSDSLPSRLDMLCGVAPIVPAFALRCWS